MASVEVDSVQNMYKTVYGDNASFIKASDEERQLQDKFPFQASEKPGEKYVEPRRMSGEHGFTFRESGERKDFNASVPLKVERAAFLGKILEFTSEYEIDAVARAVKAGPQAFRDTIGVVQEAMRDSLLKHTEWGLLRGGTPVAVVESVAAGANALQKVVTFEEATWTPTFFAEAETMPFDLYDSTSADLDAGAVKRNTSSSTANYTIVSVDMDARQLVLEADDADDWTDVVAGDCLWRYSSYLKEDLGMLAITKDQTGQIFLESPARSYSILKGVVSDSGGAISFARIEKMVATIARRSSKKASWVCRTSPLQWYQLGIEAAATRDYDASYKSTATNGFSEINFTSPHGMISIQTHSFMPDGQLHVSDDTQFSRRGVSDIDFTNFSQGDQQYNYKVLEARNAVQVRAFSEQGMFARITGRTGLFVGLDVPEIAGGI